jgi:hypothetical protein
MIKLSIAVLAASLTGQAAHAADCNSFALETDSGVTITRDEASLTLSYHGDAKRYDIAIQKLWGELTEVAVDMSGEDNQTYPMRMLDVGGKPALVVSSTVFRPNCK